MGRSFTHFRELRQLYTNLYLRKAQRKLRQLQHSTLLLKSRCITKYASEKLIAVGGDFSFVVHGFSGVFFFLDLYQPPLFSCPVLLLRESCMNVFYNGFYI